MPLTNDGKFKLTAVITDYTLQSNPASALSYCVSHKILYN